jgi:hypothetical protein
MADTALDSHHIPMNMMATTCTSKRQSARLAALGKSGTTTEELLAQEKTRVAVLEAELWTSRQKEAATAKSLWCRTQSCRWATEDLVRLRVFIGTECTCMKICVQCDGAFLYSDMKVCGKCGDEVCEDCRSDVEEAVCNVCR